MTIQSNTTYLGDGAYAVVTQWGELKVYTSNGVEETNIVILGNQEVKNLVKYIKEAEFPT